MNQATRTGGVAREGSTGARCLGVGSDMPCATSLRERPPRLGSNARVPAGPPLQGFFHSRCAPSAGICDRSATARPLRHPAPSRSTGNYHGVNRRWHSTLPPTCKHRIARKSGTAPESLRTPDMLSRSMSNKDSSAAGEPFRKPGRSGPSSQSLNRPRLFFIALHLFNPYLSPTWFLLAYGLWFYPF